MKIGQYCQRQRSKHVELEQFWQAFASRGFVSDSWAFLFGIAEAIPILGLEETVITLSLTLSLTHSSISHCYGQD